MVCLKKWQASVFVVNPTRQNAIIRGTLAEEEFTGDMDDAAGHLESIQEKGLPVDELSAYNHMAIYLRWCMEHDLMSAEFIETVLGTCADVYGRSEPRRFAWLYPGPAERKALWGAVQQGGRSFCWILLWGVGQPILPQRH